jgi:hypothetical protein
VGLRDILRFSINEDSRDGHDIGGEALKSGSGRFEELRSEPNGSSTALAIDR